MITSGRAHYFSKEELKQGGSREEGPDRRSRRHPWPKHLVPRSRRLKWIEADELDYGQKDLCTIELTPHQPRLPEPHAGASTVGDAPGGPSRRCALPVALPRARRPNLGRARRIGARRPPIRRLDPPIRRPGPDETMDLDELLGRLNRGAEQQPEAVRERALNAFHTSTRYGGYSGSRPGRSNSGRCRDGWTFGRRGRRDRKPEVTGG
jgi:hypothetical protein